MNYYKNSYDVEQDVDLVEQRIRDEFDLESNWYGDVYSYDTREVIKRMRQCKSKKQYEYLMAELEEQLKCEAISHLKYMNEE